MYKGAIFVSDIFNIETWIKGLQIQRTKKN